MTTHATHATHSASSPPETSESPGTTPGGRVRGFLKNDLRFNLPSSFVVFLVAVPLSLGIAAASGAPVMAGLIAAAVGGLVAGSLGGSPLQVSGPAAGLTVIVAGLIDQFGWQATCAITVAAGLLQILFGSFRIGRAALAVSPVVVHAMLAGIGITIVLQQLHVMIGSESSSTALANITSLPAALASANLPAILLGALVIAILVLWKKLPAGVRRVPGQLVAVVGVTILSVVLGSNVERVTFDGSILDALSFPELPEGNWQAIAMGVLSIALIASIESLLSAVALDKMHTGPRTNFDRELLGQGAANMVSGALGGLPITGVIVRSATNVEAGARSRTSTILHGVWILVFSLLFAALIQQIPQAVLAGLLIVVGVRLASLANFKTARRTGDLLVYCITLVGVVFLNLLEGVMIGLALAAALVLWRVVRASIHAEPAGPPESRLWRVVIEGSCSFLSLPRLNSVLNSVPAGSHVTIDLAVDFFDHPAYETLSAWQRQHESTGGTVQIDEGGAATLEVAAALPPRRSSLPSAMRLGVAPWKAWQGRDRGGANSYAHPHPLNPVIHGIDDYHRRHAALVRPHMQEVAHSQNPDTLFLTCADSRVIPNLITSSGPGDLFTVRNIGNVVCAHGAEPSIDAALEFGLNELSVNSIVVCGHSGCGAMAAAHNESATDAADPAARVSAGHQRGAIDAWLDHVRPSLTAWRNGHPVGEAAREAGFGEVDQLGMVNVAVQLENLQRHPLVGPAVASGRVHLAGVFYDLSTARVIWITAEGIDHLDRSHALTPQTAGVIDSAM